MQENSEQIRDRMLKLASRMWGGNEYVSEAAFDPLVGMLMAACASELSGISREIAESRLRVSEKLIDMMVPEVNSGALPAHALATALPVEEELLIKDGELFYASVERLGQFSARPMFFSPSGNFKLVKGQLSGLLYSDGYLHFDQQGVKSELLKNRGGAFTAANECWLAFKLPKGLRELNGLNIYFDFRGKSEQKNFYYLLRNASWFGGGLPVESSAGFSTDLNQDDFLFRIFGDKAVKHHAHMLHIRDFYAEKFVSLNLNSSHLKAGLPAELEDLPAKLPEEQAESLSSLVWLKVAFTQNVRPELFQELICGINTFPVSNLNRVSRIFKSRKQLNLFALSDEDYFFDLESVEDSEGVVYLESQAEKVREVEENYYILRGEGVESFDSRTASDQIAHLQEKLKNESAGFNFLDKLSFSSDLKTLSQIMARLEMGMDKLPRFASTMYLYLNTRQENRSIFVNYRTTAGELANGLKPSTPLTLYAGSHLEQRSIRLISPTIGGRSRMSRNDRLNAFKKALLTRDRIVSEEDLKAFCRLQFSGQLEGLSIRKGVQKEMAADSGFVRTIDIYLEMKANQNLSPEERMFLCKDLLVTLKKKSASIFPYRIFIDQQLMEA